MENLVYFAKINKSSDANIDLIPDFIVQVRSELILN